jgi:hypothetical protein
MASTPRSIPLPTPWKNLPLVDPIPGGIVEEAQVYILVGATDESVTDAESRGRRGSSLRNIEWDMGANDVDMVAVFDAVHGAYRYRTGS